MKIINKKEEKNKVGRPKLADSKLKKTACLISFICIVMVLGLVLGGLFDLYIIPNKLKGEVETYLCDSIPEELQYSESNPKGFKSVEIYSKMLEGSTAIEGNTDKYRNSSYCNIMTKDDLKNISSISLSNIQSDNIDGIQMLENLETININVANNLKELELNSFQKLKYLFFTSMPNIKVLELNNHQNIENLFLKDDFSNLTKLTLKDIIVSGEFSISSNNSIKELFISNVNLNYHNEYLPKLEKLTIINSNIDMAMDEFDSNLKYLELRNASNWYFHISNGGLELDSIETLIVENCPKANDFIINSKNIKNIYVNNSGDDNEEVYISFDPKNVETFTFVNTPPVILELNNASQSDINRLKLQELDVRMFLISNYKDETLDISNYENLVAIGTDFSKNKYYIQKGETFNYKSVLKLNDKYEISYESGDNTIINNNLLAKKVGTTYIKYNSSEIQNLESDENERPYDYLLANMIEVYDIDSSKYDVNTMTKEIDVNNLSLDLNKIEITSDELTKEVVGDKLYIKAGDRVVETYTLKNIKKDTPIIEDKNVSSTTNTTKKTTKKYVRQNTTTTTKVEKTTTTIKNDTLSNNKEINKVTKVIYENNNKLLLIINGIEGVLLIILLTLLIKNIKRS